MIHKKNGFVISTTLYSIFGIMLITVFYILFLLSNNRMLLNTNISDIKNDLENSNFKTSKIKIILASDTNIENSKIDELKNYLKEENIDSDIYFLPYRFYISEEETKQGTCYQQFYTYDILDYEDYDKCVQETGSACEYGCAMYHNSYCGEANGKFVELEVSCDNPEILISECPNMYCSANEGTFRNDESQYIAGITAYFGNYDQYKGYNDYYNLNFPKFNNAFNNNDGYDSIFYVIYAYAEEESVINDYQLPWKSDFKRYIGIDTNVLNEIPNLKKIVFANSFVEILDSDTGNEYSPQEFFKIKLGEENIIDSTNKDISIIPISDIVNRIKEEVVK